MTTTEQSDHEHEVEELDDLRTPGDELDQDEPEPQLAPSWSQADRYVPRRIVQPLQRFLHLEAASGLVLLAAAVVALIWVNSPWGESYHTLFETHLSVDLGFLTLDEPLEAWINDLLMAFFFFVAGMEIKRELVHGELNDPRRAMLPIVCAAGGMIVPALLYTIFNAGGPGANGWGIPMATDIAFAVGILSLVGDRAPASLKVFLLTLAIVDDIGAILVIAIFYTETLALGWLGLAAAAIALVVVMQRVRVNSLVPYIVCAAVLWLAIFESGVHATIAGVILGLLTPAWPFHPPEAVTGTIAHRVRVLRARPEDARADESEQTELASIAMLAHDAVSPLNRLEHLLHPWTSFLVLPLFALANAGVEIGGTGLGELLTEPVTLGVIVGLVVGKPLGIMAAAAIAVATKQARLPRGVYWIEMLGVGSLAGVGFTVAIFVSGLAFTDHHLTDAAKIGILLASTIAGLIGGISLAARKTT